MIVLQYHEGGVNPAKLLNQFVDSEEQKEVAGLFNARIPLETEEEKRRALHDVICNMKENSIAYQSAHMNVTDMAALQKLMAGKKAWSGGKQGSFRNSLFKQNWIPKKNPGIFCSVCLISQGRDRIYTSYGRMDSQWSSIKQNLWKN